MALKKTQPASQGEGLDFNFIHGQVEDDTHDVRLSVIIDAGLQAVEETVYGTGLNADNVTFFTDRDAAFDHGDAAEKLVGKWKYEDEKWDAQPEEVEATQDIIDTHSLKDVAVGDTLYQVNFKIVQPKPRDEIIYAADLVDMYVKYKDEDSCKPLQYRQWLNKDDFITREMVGFSTKFSPPKSKKGGWTFSPLSMHSKLAEATGHLEIIDPFGNDHGDLSLLLGEAFGIPITQKEAESKGKKYINLKAKAPVPLSKKMLKLGITELDCTPEAIEFETATVEQFKNVTPNKKVIAKIKKALNYEGSQMQKALEEYEASRGNTKPAEDVEVDEKPETPKEKAVVKKATPKAKPEVDEDDECPFDLDD